MRNLFTHPPRLPLIAPSILSADFANMGAECKHVLTAASAPNDPAPGGAGADLLHVDVMDGHFVPNLTMGPDMVKALRKTLKDCFLDVHLMVTDPWLHAQAFARAGANHITFHTEVVSPDKAKELAGKIRELGVTVGLAVNPPTPIEPVLPLIDHFDLILIMSVNPGFSGQSFLSPVLDKAQIVSEELTPLQRLEMDGGIKPDNIQLVLDAGCDVVVAASAIFGLPKAERARAVAELRGRPPTSTFQTRRNV